MKIKKKVNLIELLQYIDDNREKVKDKKMRFISDSNHNFVGVDSDDDISINFSESHNYDLTMNNDLFTIDIDVDINTYRFDELEVYYHDNDITTRTYFSNTLLDKVLGFFALSDRGKLTIIYDNKVIYREGKAIEHD